MCIYTYIYIIIYLYELKCISVFIWYIIDIKYLKYFSTNN